MDRPSPEDVGQFYDRMIPFYAAVGNENTHLGYWDTEDDNASLVAAQERMTEVMINRIAAKSGERVLDVGCGVGGPAIKLVGQTGCRVAGITVSREQVKHANQLAHRENFADRARFLHADAMELPFDDASFDAAWAFESLFHMPERLIVLREIARVLLPGGRLVFTDFFETSPLTEMEHALITRVLKVHSLGVIGQYAELMHKAGFRAQEVTDISSNTIASVAQTFLVIGQKKEELCRVYGAEIVMQLGQAWPQIEDVYRNKMGTVLVVGEKRHL